MSDAESWRWFDCAGRAVLAPSAVEAARQAGVATSDVGGPYCTLDGLLTDRQVRRDTRRLRYVDARHRGR
jgi:hypothetical protein